MSTTTMEERILLLRSSDKEIFEVAESVACESTTIKNLISEGCADDGREIPLPMVTGKILAKVIEYCKKHVQKINDSEKNSTTVEIDKEYAEKIKNWDKEFVSVDEATLFDLILAANYLDIKNLLDVTCQAVADMIKGKKPDEVRTLFNITNDFTPEEEEEIRRENKWAFE